MNGDIWQKLLQLETSDSVGLWHHKLFGRHLNQRRILEITSAARQAREFFRNAANSNSSVRPVLTFYGVASLSRALVLLFKPDMGETSLTPRDALHQ
ncbi:YaaC family protein [Pseudacidovorax sp. NFM-22]|uniref:YaaC family protein n=1 Tax=Pseudacidovorax sp. NFM-22 TaxID=2744469 RepID=UPI001F16287F|nr:YaaC family protein [Pseudacidovorax sp. NFM-22]